MSWASRRRSTYGLGALLFFVLIIGVPLAHHYISIAPTCSDGVRNQSETAIDKGGPCSVLDERRLSPVATLWARAFRVRSGSYSAVAYIQNPNATAGIRLAHYRFGLYDENNVPVAERDGTTFVMPGATTPIFEGSIDTGNRVVSHTYFEFTGPLVWERLDDTSNAISIGNRSIELSSAPRISATAINNSVRDMKNVVFIITVSDPSGNAFAASQTSLADFPSGASEPITFTWPAPFNITIGSVDITALSEPRAPRGN